MTEERKQELRQLLEEATTTENLKVFYDRGTKRIYGDWLPISVGEYQRYLRQRWDSFSEEPPWFYFHVKPHLVNETVESRLLGFIGEEFAPYVENDTVYCAIYSTKPHDGDGFCLETPRDGNLRLDACLNQLLNIAIVCSVEHAVSVFEKCTSADRPHFYFQHVLSLAGIKLESEKNEKKVCKGARLVAVPDSGALPHPLETLVPFHNMQEYFYQGKTLLIIDRPVFCIFHRPSQGPLFDNCRPDDLPFQIDLHDEKFLLSSAASTFTELLCQALSLACDSAVQVAGESWHFDERRFIQPYTRGGGRSSPYGPFARAKKVGETEIDEAKRLYRFLESKPDLRKKLRIPIERWIKSKAGIDPVDKMIDLGIALEALYVQDGGGDTTYKLAIRAARHLGADIEDPKKLLKKFKDIYRCRSNAVHSGTLDPDARFGDERIPISEFIERAQSLCRRSIKQIVEDKKKDGGFPEWDSLILGS